MKWTRLYFSVLILFLSVYVQGCGNSHEVSSGQTIAKAPEFELEDLDGKAVRLSDYSGRVVILNFWATWCFPCRIEIPQLSSLYSRYRSKGLVVIGIALDPSGHEVLREFSDEMGIHYPVLIGDDKISSDYGGVFGIPTTFIINRDGMVTSRYIGLIEESVLQKEILPLF